MTKKMITVLFSLLLFLLLGLPFMNRVDDDIEEAYRERNFVQLDYLLKKGADPDFRVGELERTAIHESILNKDLKMVKLLEQHHAKLDIPAAIGNYPIPSSWENGSMACFVYLVSVNGFEFQDDTGNGVPLAKGNAVNCLMSIARQESKLDVCDDAEEIGFLFDTLGWRFIHFSVLFENPEAVQHFISKGVNLNKMTEDGLTPLAIAKKLENHEIADMLEAHL